MRWGGGLESGLCTYTILSACRLWRPFRRFASRLEILQFFLLAKCRNIISVESGPGDVWKCHSHPTEE